MFDPEATVLVSVAVGRRLEGIERDVEGVIADGMHGDIEATPHHPVHLIVERGKCHPDRNLVTVHGSLDGGKDATVGEELDGSHSQPLVALARRGSVQPGLVQGAQQRVRVWHGQHAERESPLPRQRPVGPLGRRRAGGVVDTGHPVGQQALGGGGDVLFPSVRFAVGRHRTGVRLAEGPLDEQAGQRARRRSTDDAARRIGGTVGDPEGVETGGRHDALVQAVVDDDDGPIDAQSVEVTASGCPAPLQVAPTHGPDPRRIRIVVRLTSEGCGQVVGIGDAGQVRPARMESGDAEMGVGVDEAGGDRSSPEVHDRGRRVPVQEIGVADGGDPVPLDDDDVGPRTGAVHRQDGAPPERRRRRRSRSVRNRGMGGSRDHADSVAQPLPWRQPAVVAPCPPCPETEPLRSSAIPEESDEHRRDGRRMRRTPAACASASGGQRMTRRTPGPVASSGGVRSI